MWQKRGPALLCLLLATALTVFAAASMTETLDEIIDETLSSVESERTTRVIDSDGGAASMEKRKREGYF